MTEWPLNIILFIRQMKSAFIVRR